MPDPNMCPKCLAKMKVKKTENEEILVCDEHGIFVPKSIFGVTK